MSLYGDFAAALLEPALSPAGLVSWNGSDPLQRFAIYRNNVMVSLLEALADSFPVTRAMVGEVFFRAMAAEYVREHPPASALLVTYGATFARFIADFPPVASVPYLADLARLEWCYIEAFHAADASALPAAALLPLLADDALVAALRFSLDPSVRVVCASYAVVSLWAAHQQEEPELALNEIHTGQPEAAVLLRQAQAVEVVRVEEGAAQFIAGLLAGDSFAHAVGMAKPFDLTATLALLLRCGAITRYHLQE